jgi:hypothetical protein
MTRYFFAVTSTLLKVTVCLLIIGLPLHAVAEAGSKLALAGVQILIHQDEPSYVHHAANDLAAYLQEINGSPVPIESSKERVAPGKPVVVLGKLMAAELGISIALSADFSEEGFLIQSSIESDTRIVVAGPSPQGTNAGVATLMRMIRSEGKLPYISGDVSLRSKPDIAIRGLQAGGWPINYPYAAWKEQDWKRFIDMAWIHRINLLLLTPLLEVLPVPLSRQDEAYIQEIRRIIDYAQTERGMRVWVGMPANRIGITDCGVADPRVRPYWINGCQKDMNPADPAQFARIVAAVEPFYRIINNADGILMGDADPGGWPNSPLSEQLRIFRNAREMLNRYNVHGRDALLADFMWIGWGRHKFFTSTDRLVTGFDWSDKNPDESDIAFMAETIRNFKENLPEPWTVVAGMTPYLESAKREAVLPKAVYFPYGAIELEPAFPWTNIGWSPVNEVFEKRAEYTGLNAVFGNNQIMSLQLPRTDYFFSTAWDLSQKSVEVREVLEDVAEHIYPEQKKALVDAFLALQETDPTKIEAAHNGLQSVVEASSIGRSGVLARYFFPDRTSIAQDLLKQLDIRAARQSLLAALRGKPSLDECARLITTYFDRLLAWNAETGWENVIDTGIWTQPIYESGKDLTEGISRLKELVGRGAPYTNYGQVNDFFDPITKRLLKNYHRNSVMIGCIEPFRYAVIQAQ